MKVTYLRNPSDKSRFDVRAAVGDKLKHYNVTQGACSDGRYIYVAFEQKEHKEKKREHRIKIVKLDPETRKILKVSAPLKLGHANDMCARGAFLYVTHSGTKKVIHKVNTSTLAKGKDIEIDVPKKYRKHITGFNGISTYGEAYLLRGMGGNYVLYLDKNFKVSKIEKFTKPFKDKEDSQGMTYKDGIVYRAYSRLQSAKKNFICKFSKVGKLVSKSKVEIKGELENIFFIGDKLYGMVYRKKKKDGKTHYMSYIFKVK